MVCGLWGPEKFPCGMTCVNITPLNSNICCFFIVKKGAHFPPSKCLASAPCPTGPVWLSLVSSLRKLPRPGLGGGGVPKVPTFSPAEVFSSQIPPPSPSRTSILLLARAYSMRHWALTSEERVQLLQLWILPLRVFPARGVFPTGQVIISRKTIYTVALNTPYFSIGIRQITHDCMCTPAC